MLTGERPIPVGHGNAGRGVVEGIPHGGDELLKGLAVIGKSSGPGQPVALGIGLTGIQRQTVGMEVLLVGCDLALKDLAGHEIGAEQLIPDNVIFHREGAGLIKGEAVGAVAVCGTLCPIGGKLTGQIQIFL